MSNCKLVLKSAVNPFVAIGGAGKHGVVPWGLTGSADSDSLDPSIKVQYASQVFPGLTLRSKTKGRHRAPAGAGMLKAISNEPSIVEQTAPSMEPPSSIEEAPSLEPLKNLQSEHFKHNPISSPLQTPETALPIHQNIEENIDTPYFRPENFKTASLADIDLPDLISKVKEDGGGGDGKLSVFLPKRLEVQSKHAGELDHFVTSFRSLVAASSRAASSLESEEARGDDEHMHAIDKLLDSNLSTVLSRKSIVGNDIDPVFKVSVLDPTLEYANELLELLRARGAGKAYASTRTVGRIRSLNDRFIAGNPFKSKLGGTTDVDNLRFANGDRGSGVFDSPYADLVHRYSHNLGVLHSRLQGQMPKAAPQGMHAAESVFLPPDVPAAVAATSVDSLTPISNLDPFSSSAHPAQMEGTVPEPAHSAQKGGEPPSLSPDVMPQPPVELPPYPAAVDAYAMLRDYRGTHKDFERLLNDYKVVTTEIANNRNNNNLQFDFQKAEEHAGKLKQSLSEILGKKESIVNQLKERKDKLAKYLDGNEEDLHEFEKNNIAHEINEIDAFFDDREATPPNIADTNAQTYREKYGLPKRYKEKGLVASTLLSMLDDPRFWYSLGSWFGTLSSASQSVSGLMDILEQKALREYRSNKKERNRIKQERLLIPTGAQKAKTKELIDAVAKISPSIHQHYNMGDYSTWNAKDHLKFQEEVQNIVNDLTGTKELSSIDSLNEERKRELAYLVSAELNSMMIRHAAEAENPLPLARGSERMKRDFLKNLKDLYFHGYIGMSSAQYKDLSLLAAKMSQHQLYQLQNDLVGVKSSADYTNIIRKHDYIINTIAEAMPWRHSSFAHKFPSPDLTRVSPFEHIRPTAMVINPTTGEPISPFKEYSIPNSQKGEAPFYEGLANMPAAPQQALDWVQKNDAVNRAIHRISTHSPMIDHGGQILLGNIVHGLDLQGKNSFAKEWQELLATVYKDPYEEGIGHEERQKRFNALSPLERAEFIAEIPAEVLAKEYALLYKYSLHSELSMANYYDIMHNNGYGNTVGHYRVDEFKTHFPAKSIDLLQDMLLDVAKNLREVGVSSTEVVGTLGSILEQASDLTEAEASLIELYIENLYKNETIDKINFADEGIRNGVLSSLRELIQEVKLTTNRHVALAMQVRKRRENETQGNTTVPEVMPLKRVKVDYITPFKGLLEREGVLAATPEEQRAFEFEKDQDTLRRLFKGVLGGLAAAPEQILDHFTSLEDNTNDAIWRTLTNMARGRRDEVMRALIRINSIQNNGDYLKIHLISRKLAKVDVSRNSIINQKMAAKSHNPGICDVT